MNRIFVLLTLVFAASMVSGCVTSRDTQAVTIQKAALLPMEKEYQIKYVPDVSEGENTVFILKQHGYGNYFEQTIENYERFAFELNPETPMLDRVDINTEGLNFRFTRGLYEGPWQYNSSQEGYIYVHHESEKTIELCLDIKVTLKWGETYKFDSVEEASTEASEVITMRRFFVFDKNRLDVYASSNSIPKTLKYLETAD